MLQSESSQDEQLLRKLDQKEKELNELRKENIELNRRITNAPPAKVAQADLLALARENEDLMANIGEIKQAAISAIVAK